MLGSTSLDLFHSLHLALFRVGLSVVLTRRRVTSQSPTVGLLLVEFVLDALPVRGNELVGNARHAKDFRLDVLAAIDGVFDDGESRLVHLLQVDLQATGGVKAAIAVVALVVLGLLVRNEDLEVVKVALAVVAPWARENILEVGLVALFLVDHDCGVSDVMRCDVMCEWVGVRDGAECEGEDVSGRVKRCALE